MVLDAIEVGVERLESLNSCSTSSEPTPLVGITLTQRAKSRLLGPTEAQALRAAGIDIAGIVTATAAVEQTMLMPIGQSTPWTFAIAELADVGGFDTWNPSLVTEPIPEGVTAALVISDNN